MKGRQVIINASYHGVAKVLRYFINAVALQKIGHMMGISKGLVNDHVIQACNAVLKHRDQVIKWPNND